MQSNSFLANTGMFFPAGLSAYRLGRCDATPAKSIHAVLRIKCNSISGSSYPDNCYKKISRLTQSEKS